MTAFSSSPANRGRLGIMWHVAALLFSVVLIDGVSASGASQTFYFDLPSLEMTLDVEKTDNYLIPFQNRLRSTMTDHLEEFYIHKLLESKVGVPRSLDIELESQLLWKEVSVEPKESTEHVANHTETEFVKKYEVRGAFNCKMRLKIDPIVTESNEEIPLYVSQTLMNLFFLEAFERENYWYLMQTFLTTPVLRDIINTDINVMDIGFVHPYDEDGNLLFESDDDFEALGIDFGKRQKQSTLATVGVVSAVLLLCAVVGIWYYLCCINKGKKRWKKKRKKRRSQYRDDVASQKGSSTTGSTNSEGSDDESDDESDESDDDDEETLVGAWASTISRNLDAWASSVTSIPVRDVEKKRRKKRGAKVVQRPYFRPCQEHSSDLGCITEADNESWCSSVRSSKSGRSAKSSKSRASKYSRRGGKRPQSTKTTIIHEEEEDEDEEDQLQNSPLLTRRQLIKLMPSQDEVEDFRQNGYEF